MDNYRRFIEKRLIQIASLCSITAIVACISILSLKTTVIETEDQILTLTMPSWLDESTILTLSAVSLDDREITLREYSDTLDHIVISDKFSVYVTADGETTEISTIATTVKDVLQSANITLSGEDFLNKSLDTVIRGETTIDVTRVTRENIYDTEYIPYSSVKRSNEDMNLGETKVITNGEEGELLITTEILYYDGVAVSSSIVGEEMLKESITEVIEYGSFNVNRGVTNRDGIITTDGGQSYTYNKVIDVTATAYSTEGWSSKNTASGTVARVGAIAVDPRVIPLGSKLYITSEDGSSWIYGVAVAEDTGGAIEGNRIDLFFDTQLECRSFGVQSAKVYVLS